MLLLCWVPCVSAMFVCSSSSSDVFLLLTLAAEHSARAHFLWLWFTVGSLPCDLSSCIVETNELYHYCHFSALRLHWSFPTSMPYCTFSLILRPFVHADAMLDVALQGCHLVSCWSFELGLDTAPLEQEVLVEGKQVKKGHYSGHQLDLYHDADLQETSLCEGPLRRLVTRIQDLLVEFPGHPGLTKVCFSSMWCVCCKWREVTVQQKYSAYKQVQLPELVHWGKDVQTHNSGNYSIVTVTPPHIKQMSNRNWEAKGFTVLQTSVN